MSVPYRATEQATPQSLVFYPSFSVVGGLGRVLLGLGTALMMGFGVWSLRGAAAWLIVPPAVFLLYATAGERHEITVSASEVRLRRSLWPFVDRCVSFRRDEVSEVALERYDDQARLVLRTHGGLSHPLTEAFSPDTARTEALQRQISEVLFSEG